MLKVKSAINEALIYILLSHILFQLEGKIHYPYCMSTDMILLESRLIFISTTV